MENSLYAEVFKLKRIIRAGWKARSVQGRVESDAEHTFSMLILGLEIMSKNKLELNQLSVLKMIAYHELGEIGVGDFTPFDNITKKEKFDKEYACIKRLAETYNMPEIESYWLEFEEGKTPEAKFVRGLDRYDAVQQSKVYSELENRPGLHEEFYEHSRETAEEFDKLIR